MVQINFQLTIQGIQEIQEKPNANYRLPGLKHNKKWVNINHQLVCLLCLVWFKKIKFINL